MTDVLNTGPETETDGDMPPGPDGEPVNTGEKEQSSNLFPGMELPEDIENLAREMKLAEISRKEQLAIEREKREELDELMIEHGMEKFQLEVDGYDYEFFREEKSKVKSKKLKVQE